MGKNKECTAVIPAVAKHSQYSYGSKFLSTKLEIDNLKPFAIFGYREWEVDKISACDWYYAP